MTNILSTFVNVSVSNSSAVVHVFCNVNNQDGG